MKTLIITQARFGSTRLPGKVLKTIDGVTLLEIHLHRLKWSHLSDAIMVATTDEPESVEIVSIATKMGCLSYRGSLHHVLERFYRAAERYQPETVIRVTSDCPLNDGAMIDEMLQKFEKSDFDYYSNVHPATYPDGLDVEIFRFSALKRAFDEASKPRETEHVTPYIWEHPEIFKLGNHAQGIDQSKIRLTVDREEDFQVISKLVKQIGYDRPWRDYLALIQE